MAHTPSPTRPDSFIFTWSVHMGGHHPPMRVSAPQQKILDPSRCDFEYDLKLLICDLQSSCEQ